MEEQQLHVITGPDGYFGLEPELSSLERARFVIAQAPFDKTATFGKGTAQGPRAILEASQHVEFYDQELDASPLLEAGVCTLAPLDCQCSSKEINEKTYQSTRLVLDHKKIPVLIGGEHSVSFGAVKACHETFKELSVLQIDAHSDLRQSYFGDPFNHACVAARIAELCPIVQMGIRSREASAQDESKELKNPVWCYPASRTRSSGPWIQEAVDRLSQDVYITIDVDGFDPSVMPGTGTPEPGGLDWWVVLEVLHKVCKERIVRGIDIVEVAPISGSQQTEFAAARLLGKILSYTSFYS